MPIGLLSQLKCEDGQADPGDKGELDDSSMTSTHEVLLLGGQMGEAELGEELLSNLDLSEQRQVLQEPTIPGEEF